MKQYVENRRIKGMSVIEVLAVVFLFAMLLAIFVPGFLRARDLGTRNKSRCQNNLKQWALVFKMYASESKGELWPPMQVVGNSDKAPYPFEIQFAAGPAVNAIYPEYLTDPAIAICPSDAKDSIDSLKDPNSGNYNLQFNQDRIDASYVYLGWAFDKMGPQKAPLDTKGIMPLSSLIHFTQTVTLLGAKLPENVCVPIQVGSGFDTLFGSLNSLTIAASVKAKNPYPIAAVFNGEIPGVYYPDDRIPYGNGGSDTIFRLRKGVERHIITDINNPGASSKAQSSLWIMMDKTINKDSGTPTFNHIPGGSNVLYMDGHVEFRRYVASSAQHSGCPDEKDADQPVSPSMAAILSILTDLK